MVQILVNAKKDRVMNEIYDYFQIKRKGGCKVLIPKYSIDMHTKKVKEKRILNF